MVYFIGVARGCRAAGASGIPHGDEKNFIGIFLLK